MPFCSHSPPPLLGWGCGGKIAQPDRKLCYKLTQPNRKPCYKLTRPDRKLCYGRAIQMAQPNRRPCYNRICYKLTQPDRKPCYKLTQPNRLCYNRICYKLTQPNRLCYGRAIQMAQPDRKPCYNSGAIFTSRRGWVSQPVSSIGRGNLAPTGITSLDVNDDRNKQHILDYTFLLA